MAMQRFDQQSSPARVIMWVRRHLGAVALAALMTLLHESTATKVNKNAMESKRASESTKLVNHVSIGWRSPHKVGPRRRRLEEADNVDVLVGTHGHGHTFPGATTPWGMVIATPWGHSADPKITGWDTQSGFSSGTKYLSFHGMAHTGLSGAGSGEMGELRLLPMASNSRMEEPNMLIDTQSCKGSPGYFKGNAVTMGHASKVQIESSVTRRAAIHRMSFSGATHKAVKLLLSAPKDNFWGYRLLDYTLNVVDDRQIEGCSVSLNSGIGDAESLLCFALAFDSPFQIQPKPDGHGKIGPDVKFVFGSIAESSTITARMGVSRTDISYARSNLKQELGEQTLEEVATSAAELWETALGSVRAKFELDRWGRMFYTGLYHSMLSPNLLSERDGAYRLQRRPGGRPSVHWMRGEEHITLHQINIRMPVRHMKNGHDMYHTFSLWDTYRALHPLMNLVQPNMSENFASSLMEFADAWGFLPTFQLVQSPADMMEGDGGTIILGTMARQGLVDAASAFRVLSATRRVPVDARNAIATSPSPVVSAALEQAKADSCVGSLAQDLHLDSEAEFFSKRADMVFNDWDPKRKVFASPGSKLTSLYDQQFGYTEGSPLQYSWSAAFDVSKMIAQHGGTEAFVRDLDYFFNEAPVAKGQIDLSGNRHQMSLGDEPTLHVPYLYSLAGKAQKTQALVDDFVKNMFSDTAHGLPGNDDLGAMSSWLVFSMLGFYPVDPCSGEFVIGRPFVTTAELSLKNAKLVIRVHNQAEGNRHLDRVTLNGKSIDMQRPVLSWAELSAGGHLEMWMKPDAS